MTQLILASGSASRRAMLEAAGVPFDAICPAIDEASAKAALLADRLDGRALADALAELKATKVSRRFPEALVLGCDSTVEMANGRLLEKAESRAESVQQLRALSGTTHHLYSAAVIAQGGIPVWRFVDRATLMMRPLSEAFLDSYLDTEWPAIGGCVGGYRIEGRGAQLFSHIVGSHFTILGLPLLPLLECLRMHGVIVA